MKYVNAIAFALAFLIASACFAQGPADALRMKFEDLHCKGKWIDVTSGTKLCTETEKGEPLGVLLDDKSNVIGAFHPFAVDSREEARDLRVKIALNMYETGKCTAVNLDPVSEIYTYSCPANFVVMAVRDALLIMYALRDLKDVHRIK